MVNLGPLSGEKSPYMKLMEWLYDNGYDHIHDEWYAELGNRQPFKLPIDEWLKEKHSAIWKEYREQENL